MVMQFEKPEASSWTKVHEVWMQPNVPDSGAAYLDLVGEPRP